MLGNAVEKAQMKPFRVHGVWGQFLVKLRSEVDQRAAHWHVKTNKTLQTKYRIRASIPTTLVRSTKLKEEAQKLGLRIAVDDLGNVEGAWDSSLLTLHTVLETLRQLGLRGMMIQRSVVSFTVAVEESLMHRVFLSVRSVIGRDPESCTDVLTHSSILRFVVPCEKAMSLATALNELGVSEIVAHESYESENTDV